ncbi:MAG: recombinase, partial [Flavobacteriia bacterium]
MKKELDKWFSLFIRLREANEYGMVQCFTCGKVAHYKDGMQNGHFQSRKHMSTRFDEENCQVQCIKCNMFSQGEQFKFGIHLDAKYGEGTAEY